MYNSTDIKCSSFVDYLSIIVEKRSSTLDLFVESYFTEEKFSDLKTQQMAQTKRIILTIILSGAIVAALNETSVGICNVK